MQRQVWAFAEAWVTVWREVAGSKSGNALLEAKYMRSLSLSERPNIIRKRQPGLSHDTPVINGVQTTFKIEKGFLSKAVTVGITNPAYVYWIEVSLVNPRYDVTQSDDLYELKTCTYTVKGFSGKDNDILEEEVAYDVGEVA